MLGLRMTHTYPGGQQASGRVHDHKHNETGNEGTDSAYTG